MQFHEIFCTICMRTARQPSSLTGRAGMPRASMMRPRMRPSSGLNSKSRTLPIVFPSAVLTTVPTTLTYPTPNVNCCCSIARSSCTSSTSETCFKLIKPICFAGSPGSMSLEAFRLSATTLQVLGSAIKWSTTPSIRPSVRVTTCLLASWLVDRKKSGCRCVEVTASCGVGGFVLCAATGGVIPLLLEVTLHR